MIVDKPPARPPPPRGKDRGKDKQLTRKWEPQLLQGRAAAVGLGRVSTQSRPAPRGRSRKKEARQSPPSLDDFCEDVVTNCCCCVTEAYDLLTCNYNASSYCLLSIFLIGTLTWNVGFMTHMHSQAAHNMDLGVDSGSLQVVESPGHSRDKLRCLNLDSMWKKHHNSDTRRTDEEMLLWNSLNCEALLRDMTSGANDETMKRKCLDLQSKYSVQPGRSWGWLPKSLQRQWKSDRCDCYTEVGCELIDESERGQMIGKGSGFPGLSQLRHKEQIPFSITAEGIWDAVHRRPREIVALRNATLVQTAEQRAEHPIIAVLVPCTSRGFRWKSLSNVPVVRFLFPSLVKTVETGFIFRVYLGFDLGDLYFDNPVRIADLAKTFEEEVAKPTRQQGVSIELILEGFQNSLRKPGPMFNFLSASALQDGADYVYRVNDDTEFRTLWASSYVLQLATFNPPNVGVVGPTCKEGNYRILTHDFVHKTHAYIFSTHYPPVLMDWWMDDWISTVYSSENTRRLSRVLVVHHLESTSDGEVPVRYSVDYRHKAYLKPELSAGRELIDKFVKTQCSGSVSRRLTHLGVSAPSCPAPSCPAPSCPAPASQP